MPRVTSCHLLPLSISLILVLVVVIASFAPLSRSSPRLSTMAAAALPTTAARGNYVWLVQLEFHEGKKAEVTALRSPHAPASPSLPPLLLTSSSCASAVAVSNAWQWLTYFTEIAKHVRDFEPRCLSYELYNDAAEPNRVMIFERYVTEEDLTVTHRQSVPFLALRARSKEITFVKDYKSSGYYETNTGFISRKE